MKLLSLAILLFALGSFSLFSQTPDAKEIPLNFQHEGLENILQVYADLAQRTVLRADLPAAHITLKATATNRAQALMLVAQALAKEHLTLIMDGEKFVLVVPDSEVAHAKAVLAKNPSTVEKNTENKFPNGTINMIATPISDTLPIYQQVAGANSLEPNPAFPLPQLNISLSTETALTQKEVIHAFDIIFGLNGFKMVRTADNKLKAVPF